MPELYASTSFLLHSAANADATWSDCLGLVFGQDGTYIPKALRADTSDLIEVPQHYTADRSVLGKMLGIARRLKQLNPELMDIKDDTIMKFSKEMVRDKLIWQRTHAFYQPLCPHCHGSGEIFITSSKHKSKLVACTKCFRGISPHIYVNPAFLRSQAIYIDHDEALALDHPDWEWDTITGDFALILLTCHELAHDLTWHLKSNHGKKWQRWFAKFLRQIIQDIR